MDRPLQQLFSALALACVAAGAGAVPLRVIAQESIPPKWIARPGHMDGLCPDVLAAIENMEPRLRFAGAIEARSLPAIENALAGGSADVACALIDTPERRRIARTPVVPLYMIRERLAAAAGDMVDIDNLEQLAALKPKPLVNMPRGSGGAYRLHALGIAVDDSTGDNVANLRKTIAGHGRFTYVNELTLGWVIKEAQLSDKVRLLPAVMAADPAYLWISKKTDTATAVLLEQTLVKLKANGELDRIYDRWANP